MTDRYEFHPTVLREYDIRGIVGKTLNPSDATAVGRAFGTVVKRSGGRRVCVGYDGRLSSPELEAALVEGLVSTGVEVVRVGLGPTPMLYYATKHFDADAGVMITGSHNPPEYNGIKMLTSKGPVYGDAIQELGRLAAKADYERGEGTARQEDIREAYVAKLASAYEGGPDMTVCWDAGNGAAGDVLRMLAARLPGKHYLLYDKIDGTFPNHHPDPTVPENLVDLQKLVREKKAHLGVAFDGDADRIGAVDEDGGIVWGDQLIAIYAMDLLKADPGAMVIADVKTSQTVFDQIASDGGKPLMWKTGHSLLKAKMAELGAPLAGEMSGHIFFRDWWNFDDALYNALRLVNLVSSSGQRLSALRDRLPKVFNTPEVRFQVSEERKFRVVEEVKQRLKAAGADVNDIDGVRVKTADGWWLLRASNTQDVLVARAEALSQDGLERLKAILVDQLERSGLSAPNFAGGGH